MKLLYCLIPCFFLSLYVSAQRGKAPGHVYPVINGNAPHVLKWDTTTIDMGTIPQGMAHTVKFQFTNTGHSPVILQDVHPTCSCTSPDWTRNPIPPGKTGYVMATYNAAASGNFNKSIAVTTNEGEMAILVIKGYVNPSGK